jgi:hypothetical protein
MLHHVLPKLPGCTHNTNFLHIHPFDFSRYAAMVVGW